MCVQACVSARCAGGEKSSRSWSLGARRVWRDWKQITEGPVCCGEGCSPGLRHKAYRQSLQLRQSTNLAPPGVLGSTPRGLLCGNGPVLLPYVHWQMGLFLSPSREAGMERHWISSCWQGQGKAEQPRHECGRSSLRTGVGFTQKVRELGS